MNISDQQKLLRLQPKHIKYPIKINQLKSNLNNSVLIGELNSWMTARPAYVVYSSTCKMENNPWSLTVDKYKTCIMLNFDMFTW